MSEGGFTGLIIKSEEIYEGISYKTIRFPNMTVSQLVSKLVVTRGDPTMFWFLLWIAQCFQQN